jgi:hypothetical protein
VRSLSGEPAELRCGDKSVKLKLAAGEEARLDSQLQIE